MIGHPLFLVLVVVMGVLAESAHSATYYVATNGSDSNSGTSENAPWATIVYAATQATAGDTVYIKAGDYGNESVLVSHSGTTNSPVKFEGYRVAPGDVSSPGYFDLRQTGGPSPPALDSTMMPLFNGIFDVSYRSNVEVRHLQINGGIGIYMSGAHQVTIDHYLSDGCSRAVEIIASTAVTVRNSQVKNASIYPYQLRASSYSWIENCTSHYVSTDADYHFKIEGYEDIDVQGNTLLHCYAEGDTTGVHGIGIKGETCFNNTIEDCVARNFSNNFYVRHHNVYSNAFRGCTAYGGVNGYVARDGAHDNHFIYCETVGSSRVFTCFDSSEDKGEGSQRGKNTFSCEGNTFTDCIFKDASQYGILFDDVAHDSPAASNKFDRCTFDGGGTLVLHQTSDNHGNEMKNSIITGYATCEDYEGGSGQFVFSGNTWSNNGFPAGCGSDGGVIPPPALSLTRNGSTFTLSWPTAATGWLLHATTNLATVPTSWIEIPPPYQTNGTNLSFTELLLIQQKFYRLHKP